MALDINIQLSDEDLEHFISGMQDAQKEAADLSATEITASARKLLVQGNEIELPDFIASRLSRLNTMIDMAEDEGFGLPEEDRARVLAALTYFADPSDIIPDSVPVLGFLDDAIMIELCQRELVHELSAYEEFDAWRRGEAEHRGVDPAELKLKRVDWAEDRRAHAIELMRQRRSKSYTSGAWAPVLFKPR
ncbi:MAG: YkvA family protein [Rhodanobacteraceae bacterium]